MKKIAIVTVASREIGKSIAIKLAEEGYKVVINDNQGENDAKDTLKKVNKYTEWMIIKANVSRRDEANKQVVISMLNKELDINTISEYTELDIDTINKIKQEWLEKSKK